MEELIARYQEKLTELKSKLIGNKQITKAERVDYTTYKAMAAMLNEIIKDLTERSGQIKSDVMQGVSHPVQKGGRWEISDDIIYQNIEGEIWTIELRTPHDTTMSMGDELARKVFKGLND